jgi:hypothetical protein
VHARQVLQLHLLGHLLLHLLLRHRRLDDGGTGHERSSRTRDHAQGRGDGKHGQRRTLSWYSRIATRGLLLARMMLHFEVGSMLGSDQVWGEDAGGSEV